MDGSSGAPDPRANGPSAAAVASMTEVEVVARESQMRMGRAAAPGRVDRQDKSSSSAANANAGVVAEVPPLDADKGVALTVAVSVQDDAYAKEPKCEEGQYKAIYAFPFDLCHFPRV